MSVNLCHLSVSSQNVASRMESNSKPGYVRLSWQTAGALPQEVLRLVKGETIDVKGEL